MYKKSYAETLADSTTDARAQERRALDRAIVLLGLAAERPQHSPEELAALEFVTQLWAVFIKDLANPGNDLPELIRANLMSIGLGIMAEVQRIQLGQSRDIAAVAEICSIVRDGLE